MSIALRILTQALKHTDVKQCYVCDKDNIKLKRTKTGELLCSECFDNLLEDMMDVCDPEDN